MQRQAVSCIKPEAPLVGTGMEAKAARDSGTMVIWPKKTATVTSVTGDKIVVVGEKGKKKEYQLLNFCAPTPPPPLTKLRASTKARKLKKAIFWPTALPPKTANWLWDKMFWWRFCPGKAATTKTLFWLANA